MNDFKKGGFRKSSGGFSGRSKFGGDKKFGKTFKPRHDREDRGSERTEMFSTTCSSCHKSCDVPFRPSADKPVYCRECFADKRDGQDSTLTRPNNSSRNESRPQYKPASLSGERGNDDLKQQLIKIESKLNRILEIINPPIEKIRAVSATTAEVDTIPKKERKPKVEKIKVSEKKKVTKKTK